MANENSQKNAYKYLCDICDFKCSKASNWEKHILTAKHKRLTKTNEKIDHFVSAKNVVFLKFHINIGNQTKFQKFKTSFFRCYLKI